MARNEVFWRSCRFCGDQIASGRNLGGDDGIWYSKREISTGGIAKYCPARFLTTGAVETSVHQPYDRKPESMPLEEWLDA